MKNIFIDMDGVIAEYRKDCTEELLSQQGYFLNLKPEMNMLYALSMLIRNAKNLGYNVCILTKVYLTMFTYSVEEKKKWCSRYIPEALESNFIFKLYLQS